jgi:hypothetical protein
MNVNAEASSSRSGYTSGTRANTSKDEEVPVSATQKKQNDFRRYLAGQSVMKSGKFYQMPGVFESRLRV